MTGQWKRFTSMFAKTVGKLGTNVYTPRRIEMTYTKHLTQQNNRSKIVFKGKKGTASFPAKQFFRAPIAQEKLYEDYWKGMIV